MPEQRTADDSLIATRLLPAALMYGGRPATKRLIHRTLGKGVMAGEPAASAAVEKLRRIMNVTDVPIMPPDMGVEPGFARAVKAPGFIGRWIRDVVQSMHGGDKLSDPQLYRGVIMAPKSAPMHVLAHEMGHAAPGRLARALQLGKILGPVAAAIPMMYKTHQIASDEDNTLAGAALKGGLTGAGFTALGSIPKLLEEFRASRAGLKGLQQLGHTAPQLAAARKSMLRAFGTHALVGPLSMALVGAGIAMMLRRKKRKNTA